MVGTTAFRRLCAPAAFTALPLLLFSLGSHAGEGGGPLANFPTHFVSGLGARAPAATVVAVNAPDGQSVRVRLVDSGGAPPPQRLTVAHVRAQLAEVKTEWTNAPLFAAGREAPLAAGELLSRLPPAAGAGGGDSHGAAEATIGLFIAPLRCVTGHVHIWW